MGEYSGGPHGTFNCKGHVTIKVGDECGYTRCVSSAEYCTKNLIVDSSSKLTNNGWIGEQSEDSDINLIVQLLKSDKLKSYVAREVDSSGVQVLLKYCKDLLLKNGLLYQKVLLENNLRPISQFVLPKCFVHRVILVCHDDNGHLSIGRTLGLLQDSFGLKWQMM